MAAVQAGSNLFDSLNFRRDVKAAYLFTKRQNFGLYQRGSICRRQNNCSSNYISAFDRTENIVRKGENAGYQHFLLFLQCFQTASFLGDS